MSFTVRCPYCHTLISCSVSNGTTRCKNCKKTVRVRNGQARVMNDKFIDSSFKYES